MMNHSERQSIDFCVTRAIALYEKHNVIRDRASIALDLLATNRNCPLDFARLADFNDASFAHDIGGISRHLNRDTYELEDCFVPRCAK